MHVFELATKHPGCTALDDTNQQRMLDAAADHIESTAAACGFALRVLGGAAYDGWAHKPDRPTLKLSVNLAAGTRDNVTACERFADCLCKAFRCERAGVDATEDVVWLIGIGQAQPATTERFAHLKWR